MPAFSLALAVVLILFTQRSVAEEKPIQPPSRAFCSINSPCPARETCDELLYICVKSSVDPSAPSPDTTSVEDDVCMDVAYLTALGHTADELVHASHILAATLCPDNGLPCATANHMVRISGERLSYEQLCERVLCTKKTTAVNSVFTHIWKERMHGDVALTMYDVRHPEMMQHMLHRVSHVVRKIIG